MKNTYSVIALAIVSSTPAIAGVVDMKFTGTGAGSTIQLHMGANVRDSFAGEIFHEITNAAGAEAFLNGAHTTFCPDISEVVTSDFENYIVSDIEDMPLTDGGPAPMGLMKADAIRALYSATASTLMAGGLSNDYATAFQLVVWEIVDDFNGTAGSIDADAGNLILTATDGNAMSAGILAAMATLTSDMMNAIATSGGSYDNVIGLANAGFQDQLVLVPAPGAMALFAAGGLIATRRRRN
jgi:hypothetical protein